MRLSAASLFAGIGGFDLALDRLGHDTVLQAEIDPSAQRVLRARFPGTALVDDAASVDLRGIDLVTMGFPCQGLSSAATTRTKEGLFDPNSMSHVVWNALERVFAARPRYLLLENADSLSSQRFSDDLEALLAAMRANGYVVHVTRLNAGCFGSHMRRVRTFILARHGEDWSFTPPASFVGWTATADAFGVNNQQGGGSFSVQPSVTKSSETYTLMVTRDGVFSLLPEAVERLFGFPTGWSSPAESVNARYNRLGNAVSVDCAEAALSLLLHGSARTRKPSTRYVDLLTHAQPAGRGTAASALGRIMRSLATKGGWKSPIEWDHGVPVYLRWIDERPGTITPKMQGYIDAIRPLRAAEPVPPWPREVRVVMKQGT